MNIGTKQVFKIRRGESFCLLCITSIDPKKDIINAKLSEISNPSEIESIAMKTVGGPSLEYAYVTNNAGVFFMNYNLNLNIAEFNALKPEYYCNIDNDDFIDMLKFDIQLCNENTMHFLDLDTFSNIYKCTDLESVAAAVTKRNNICRGLSVADSRESFKNKMIATIDNTIAANEQIKLIEEQRATIALDEVIRLFNTAAAK